MGLILIILKKRFFLEWNFFFINRFIINMFLYIDWIRIIFMFTVLLISSIIMIYRREYINSDINKNRFFYLLFLFIISIIFIIISPNLMRILIGWDGLGLISYCLVIYYQRYSSYNSGMITVLINRIGDVFILVSLSILIIFGRWNFLNFNNCKILILLYIILASFTKRAQVPFSSWLPAAIAAPTPVSSLVHSSTLVTAGVYLLIRFHYLIFKNDNLLIYLLITGLLTMLIAGISANFEYDLKKIIAYSTLSQLGLIIIILGIKNFELAFFHLIIHAIFKSIIFMCSGVMIHSFINYQDIRNFGFLNNFMPLTSSIFFISNLSLCGIPFFSGFYSKDQILEFISINNLNFIIYIFILIGTGFTVSYRVRLTCYLINKNLNFVPLNNLMDRKFINYSMFILFNLTICFGYLINWIIFSIIEDIYLLFIEKIIIILVCLIFIIVGIYEFKLNLLWNKNYFIKYFLGSIWLTYDINKIIYKLFLFRGLTFLKILDKGFIEWIFKNSLKTYSIDLNLKFYKLNFNNLVNFIIIIVYILIIIILIY